ncbi:MAG: TIGR00159 family protein [Tenericutes bacterium HGW-Tenericutes-8]|nr:MAG: TIGR00159 family protein [Tenericutes bacterium HGW-Tenericutes-8]
MDKWLLILLDGYIVWMITFFLLSFFLSSKRVFRMLLLLIFIYVIALGAKQLGLDLSARILDYSLEYLPLMFVVILAPDIRKSFESAFVIDNKRDVATMGSTETKQHIVEAVSYLSSQNIGALITIEKHSSLDQYAERAIMMNSQVSKELLVNIFTPLTPLHDGAVIIRGDTIRCAGAYYVLSETNKYDKTMGSRHRAALGISEVSDSLTIVVSEETGTISIVIEGIMLKANDKEKIYEYLNMFMK